MCVEVVMKFWNKQKDVRLRCWTCVQLPCRVAYSGWIMRTSYTSLKRKLQNMSSKGKFYMPLLKKEIWFERSVDATWFILTDYEKAKKEK